MWVPSLGCHQITYLTLQFACLAGTRLVLRSGPVINLAHTKHVIIPIKLNQDYLLHLSNAPCPHPRQALELLGSLGWVVPESAPGPPPEGAPGCCWECSRAVLSRSSPATTACCCLGPAESHDPSYRSFCRASLPSPTKLSPSRPFPTLGHSPPQPHTRITHSSLPGAPAHHHLLF